MQNPSVSLIIFYWFFFSQLKFDLEIWFRNITLFRVFANSSKNQIKFWSASSNPVGCLASPNTGDLTRKKSPSGGEIQELWNAQFAKSPHQPGEADDKGINEEIHILNYSWTPIIRTRLFRIPRSFELKTIFLGFALQSFTVGYFELPLFRTSFRFPREFEIAGFNCSITQLVD